MNGNVHVHVNGPQEVDLEVKLGTFGDELVVEGKEKGSNKIDSQISSLNWRLGSSFP